MVPSHRSTFPALIVIASLVIACGGSVSVLHAKGKPTGTGSAAMLVLNSSGTTIQELYVARTEDVNKAKAAHVEPGSADDRTMWGEDKLDNAGLGEGKTFDELKLA